MANNSFRDSVNSLGWSRRDQDLPIQTGGSSNTTFLSRLQSYNPFSDGGYVQLPTHNEAPGAPLPAPSRREEEEGFFACKSYLLDLVTLKAQARHTRRSMWSQVMDVQFLRREDS